MTSLFHCGAKRHLGLSSLAHAWRRHCVKPQNDFNLTMASRRAALSDNTLLITTLASYYYDLSLLLLKTASKLKIEINYICDKSMKYAERVVNLFIKVIKHRPFQRRQCAQCRARSVVEQ